MVSRASHLVFSPDGCGGVMLATEYAPFNEAVNAGKRILEGGQTVLDNIAGAIRGICPADVMQFSGRLSELRHELNGKRLRWTSAASARAYARIMSAEITEVRIPALMSALLSALRKWEQGSFSKRDTRILHGKLEASLETQMLMNNLLYGASVFADAELSNNRSSASWNKLFLDEHFGPRGNGFAALALRDTK